MATEFMIRNLMIFETNFHIPYKKDLKKIVNVKNATKKQLGRIIYRRVQGRYTEF